VKTETGGVGADAVIVAAPEAAAQEQALDLVRKRGSVCLFASLPVGASVLSLDSRKIHYNELFVCGASDSTPAHVQNAVGLLGQPDFPGKLLANPLLKLADIQKAFATMAARDGMRVVLRP
jgi:L-iditol 2-dehydrogenase